jgi:metalloendopeptidase OMA1, mitochondrial
MDLQYFVMDEVFGTLHFAPFSHQHPPRRVLDVGTGTGLWCIQMGDLYPSADILGIDISPIQPREVPLNVRFMVDDA